MVQIEDSVTARLSPLETDPPLELVVLLADDGSRIGTTPKSTVHNLDTALHLAFSCHVLNDQGEVLVTRRALGKRAWPGVWSNAFCGHPLPDESMPEAIARRATFELGLMVRDITVILPDFRYRATDSSGIVENEICPVYVATAVGSPAPNADEVAEYAWTSPLSLQRAAADAPWAFSPWLILQLAELETAQRSLGTTGSRAPRA